MERIYLSPPHLGEAEQQLMLEALASNWVAPLGPNVDAFEKEFAQAVGVEHAAALSSGTAAIHLALRLHGVSRGDKVLCSTLTFVASAAPIMYEGAEPVFIDSERQSWNMDPELLAAELHEAARRGRLPRAVVVVDLYGQTANYDPILQACAAYDVPVIEDAAEALGATYKSRPAGALGKCAAFSFNGNKIITTSGGGMLVSDDASLIERARFHAAQARDCAPHYQHSKLGFNYRMSNILAALGRGQLQNLQVRIEARRRNWEFYKENLGVLPGVQLMPQVPWGSANYWLSCITIDEKKFGASAEQVRKALEAEHIEARPVWKPLHLQPLFAGCRCRGGAVAEDIFAQGLCLPSGSSLTLGQLERIVGVVRSAAR